MVNLTLRHGISVHSATGVSYFSAIICRKHQNVKYGNHFGKLALLLLKKNPSKDSAVNVNAVILSLVKWHDEHIGSLIKPWLHTYKMALEIGNHEKVEISINNYCYNMFLSGQSMASLQQGIATFMEAHFVSEDIKSIPKAIEKIISIFVFSETRNSVNLIKSLIYELKSRNIVAGRSSAIYLFCLMAATFFCEYSIALNLIEVMTSSLIGTYLSAVNEFFVGLVSLSIAKNSAEKSKLMSVANECIEKLMCWSLNCPYNISNKLVLLRAELSAVNGDDSRAMEFYDQSIALAKKSKFIHEEALACEKAAMFLFERKNEHNAHFYLLRAYMAYFQWGATAKMKHLCNLFPSLVNSFNSFHFPLSQTSGVPLDICVSASTESASQVSDLQRSNISSSKREKKKTRTI